jgi:hypothetical protein
MYTKIHHLFTHRLRGAWVAVAVFVIAGLAYTVVSIAATYFVSMKAESGTIA